MNKKGYISEFLNGGRIVSHGQVTDLSKGFKLKSGNPFSVYIRPRSAVVSFDTVINVKCYQDDAFHAAPFTFYDWSPLSILEIEANEELLNDFEIFWGSGNVEE